MQQEFSPILNLDMFPQKLMGFTYPGDIQSFINKAYEIESNYPHEGLEHFKNIIYTSPYFLDQKFPEFIPLREYIIKIVELNYQFKCRVQDMWINIYKKYGYNDYHTHKPCPLVGVLFLKVPSNHSGLSLHNKFNPDQKYTINPPPGSLILFEGDQAHSSLPNPTDEEKIIIAFNLEKRD